MSALADQYESRFPGTGCPPEQKAERMERMLLKETGSIRPARDVRRGRVRLVVPELPWLTGREGEDHAGQE